MLNNAGFMSLINSHLNETKGNTSKKEDSKKSQSNDSALYKKINSDEYDHFNQGFSLKGHVSHRDENEHYDDLISHAEWREGDEWTRPEDDRNWNAVPTPNPVEDPPVVNEEPPVDEDPPVDEETPLFTDSADTVTLDEAGTYNALEGDDTITANVNDSTINGNEGNDSFIVGDTATNNVFDGNEGNADNATLNGSSDSYEYAFDEANNSVVLSKDGKENTFKNIENFTFDGSEYSYNSLLEAYGPPPPLFTDGADTVTLDESGTYNALEGDDTITANVNDSTINGNEGDDHFIIGSEATGNTINGNEGDADSATLTGNDYAYEYEFDEANNAVTISNGDVTNTFSGIENFTFGNDETYTYDGLINFVNNPFTVNDADNTIAVDISGSNETWADVKGDNDNVGFALDATGNTIDAGEGTDVLRVEDNYFNNYTSVGSADDFTLTHQNGQSNTFQGFETVRLNGGAEYSTSDYSTIMGYEYSEVATGTNGWVPAGENKRVKLTGNGNSGGYYEHDPDNSNNLFVDASGKKMSVKNFNTPIPIDNIGDFLSMNGEHVTITTAEGKKSTYYNFDDFNIQVQNNSGNNVWQTFTLQELQDQFG